MPSSFRFSALAFVCLCTALTVTPTSAQVRGGSTGPDVTVHNLWDLTNHGQVGQVRAYSIGTDSCNVGDQPVNWCNDGPASPGESPGCGPLFSNQHPVIAGNLYRVKEGRFEQLGKSWLKNGFFSVNTSSSSCGQRAGQNCTFPPLGGDQLGVGCTDVYYASLNGSRTDNGMRAEINPTNVFFPYPPTDVPHTTVIDQRLQVQQSDIDPELNPGARYFAESQYLVDDDALAGNGLNNASYAEVVIEAGTFDLEYASGHPTLGVDSTVRELSALHAWPAIDSSVDLVNADYVGDLGIVERFEVAHKVTFSGGTYTTVIAVRNMNSQQAARRLRVEFAGPGGISNPGFHDVDTHSGETIACNAGQCPLSSADWLVDTSDPTRISWATDSFVAAAPTANALRWGTAYTFWFDSLADPRHARYYLDLYQPGSTMTVEAPLFVIFVDGFENGDLDSWAVVSP